MPVATFDRKLKGLIPKLKNKDGWWKRLDISQKLRFFRKVKLIPWSRQMYQASQFDQLMPKLTKLMALLLNRLV